MEKRRDEEKEGIRRLHYYLREHLLPLSTRILKGLGEAPKPERLSRPNDLQGCVGGPAQEPSVSGRGRGPHSLADLPKVMEIVGTEDAGKVIL
jgi:hypothetical protein